MIYLAAPYSHTDKSIIQWRMEKIYAVMAVFIKQGKFILTPLAMHEVAIRHEDMPDDFTYWGNYCLDLLKRCDSMVVLQLPGWKESYGVQKEIEFCNNNNISIKYLSEEEWKHYIITNAILL
jgi:hypothetical protein